VIKIPDLIETARKKIVFFYLFIYFFLKKKLDTIEIFIARRGARIKIC